MSNHTQLPWADDGFAGIAATGSDQFNGGFFIAICEGPDKQANARRIVACVNACEGVETAFLEMDTPAFVERLRERSDFKKQRDELLEALQDLLSVASMNVAPNVGGTQISKAFAILAKARRT